MLEPRATFIKGIGAAALLSCVIFGTVSALTASSSATDVKTVMILVDRTNKSDRLSPAATLRQDPNSSSSKDTVSPKRLPLGCDPEFSPVVDPERAQLFNRCMV